MASRDAMLAVVAAGQFGMFGRQDVGRLGFTRGEVQHRCRCGRWEPVAPGVWRFAGAPTTWHGLLWAGTSSLGPDAVISHRSAAALHGFDNFARRPLEITVPRRRRTRLDQWSVHTTSSLPLIDRSTVDGLRVTSATRTLVDLARTDVSPSLLESAIDSAIRLGLSSPALLERRIETLRGPGRAGIRRLDTLIADSGGHSPLERAFLRVVRAAGLPRPRCQVIHRRDGVTFARVDFEWTDERVVVEVNGRRGHASDAERAKDAHRQNELQADGFVVLVFTTTQVRQHPADVAATLRRALRR